MSIHHLDDLAAELRALGDPSERQGVLQALAELAPDPRIGQVLLEHLGRLDLDRPGEGYEMATVIGLLASRKDGRAIRPIFDLLRDLPDSHDSVPLEQTLLDALVALEAVEALPHLREALGDSDWEYFEVEVADAIAALGGQAEVGFFLDVVQQGHHESKLAALRVLTGIVTDDALPRLRLLREDQEDDVRWEIDYLIASRGPKDAADIVRTLFDQSTRASLHMLSGEDRALELMRRLGLTEFTDDLWSSYRSIAPEQGLQRLKLLETLVCLDAPGAIGELEDIRAGDCTPWFRIKAAAMLIAQGARHDLHASLIDDLRRFEERANDDNGWHRALSIAPYAFDVLVEHAPEPAAYLAAVDLLDDIRRERIRVPQFVVREHASQIVHRIAGSEWFADFDRWRADYCREHGLT